MSRVYITLKSHLEKRHVWNIRFTLLCKNAEPNVVTTTVITRWVFCVILNWDGEKLLKSFSFADENKISHFAKIVVWIAQRERKKSVENLLYKVKNHKARNENRSILWNIKWRSYLNIYVQKTKSFRLLKSVHFIWSIKWKG